MITDWHNSKLCSAWINEIGEYGDLPRKVFTIPIVSGLSERINNNLPLSPGIMKNSVIKLMKEIETDIIYDNRFNGHAPFNGLNCLDFGCGEGYLGRFLTNLGANYLGFDGSPYFIKAASKKESNKLVYKLANLDFFDSDHQKNPIHYDILKFFNLNEIDIIFLHSIIEHLTNFKYFFSHFANWAYKYCSQAVILLICLEKKFFTDVIKRNNSTPDKPSSFSHYIKVPNTISYVRINFYSDNEIKNVIKRTKFRIIDNLNFSNCQYSPQICDLFNDTIENWVDIGPFRAYLLAIN